MIKFNKHQALKHMLNGNSIITAHGRTRWAIDTEGNIYRKPKEPNTKWIPSDWNQNADNQGFGLYTGE